VSEPQTLPTGWVQTTLGEIADIERGITFPASAKSTSNQDGLIPCLRTTNIQNTVEWDDMLFVPQAFMKDNERKLIQNMDILMSVANSRELVGKVALVVDIPYNAVTLGGFISAIRAIVIDNAKYLYYFLRFRDTKAELKKHASQTVNIANLSMESVAHLPLPLPPLAEQRRIVAAIEQQFTRLDAGIASLRQAQTRLKRYRAAVLKAAVEGHLTAAWRSEHPDTEPAATLLARILTERRTRWEGEQRAKGKDPAKLTYDEPARPDTATLPALPEGWTWTILDAIADIIDPNPSHRMPFYPEEGVPFISSENFINGDLINLSMGKRVDNRVWEEQRTRFTIEEGDFVLSRIGTIGKTRFLPTNAKYCLSHALVVIKTRSGLINKRFLRQTVASDTILSQAKDGVQSVGVPDLGMGKIRSFLLPLPPLAEQEQIVTEVERRLSVVSEVEAEVLANLKRAERLRQSILREAFAGRLVAQDPADESASVLLERIRAERSARDNNGGRSRRKADTAPQPTTTRPDSDTQVERMPQDVRQMTLLESLSQE